jgi:MoxR-like ATPase
MKYHAILLSKKNFQIGTIMESETMREQLSHNIQNHSIQFQQLADEVNKVIVGQSDAITYILISLICDGHILLEGVPGVAKTTLIKTATQALGLSFKRIQFTPDLLPADLIGTLMYNQKTHEFETKKGPVFANCILADEINRAPAKVQAALLEAMQERQVTIGSQTYKLDEPFLVFATQNPVEQEGTYQLPEAQVDRFMCKIFMDYPSMSEEKEILKRSNQRIAVNQSVLSKDDIAKAQQLTSEIYCDDSVSDYILSIVHATRTPLNYGLKNLASYMQYGASPRATIAMHNAARAHAFLHKRYFVTPDDVKSVAPAILRHRIITTFEAEADTVTPDIIIKTILHRLPTP